MGRTRECLWWASPLEVSPESRESNTVLEEQLLSVKLSFIISVPLIFEPMGVIFGGSDGIVLLKRIV